MQLSSDHKFSKTRIAPTPSGFLHLGNIFSFALTVALAKKTGAEILLRIDDLDTERVNEGYIKDIFETLEFMKISWQQGPKDEESYQKDFKQERRMTLYKKAFDRLIEKRLVYACNCSRSQILAANEKGFYPGTCRHKEIPLDAKNVSWRLHTDAAKQITANILGGKTEMADLPDEICDVVIRRKDGLPSYQLASVVDDEFFETDLIVRGKDLWPSTLVQLYLARVLETQHFQKATFFHHQLLVDNNRQKLSKSAGSVSIKHMRENGLPSDAIYKKIGNELKLTGTMTHWNDLLNITGGSLNNLT